MFRSKPVTWVTLILLLIGPIGLEAFLASVSQNDALFPRPALFAGEILLIVTLMTILVSVMALGNDYDLGTVRVVLSRGAERYQFILSKVLATVVVAFAYGFAYISSTLLATVVAHVALSDVPLAEAAGTGLAWRALGAVGVIGLTSLVFTGVVMLALVMGQSSWMGMLAGLGSFMIDFYVGGLSTAGNTDAYRYTITYHASSLLERCFASNTTGMRMSGLLAEHGLAEPGQAMAALFLYSFGFTLAAILIFRHQDLTAKS
jgi:ABC-type transport system involved in multi-copper enzyme maturation permease subunit